MPKFYVTTPIYYINDRPHIGHAYSSIAADVLARYHRSLGEDVLFSMGVDENGQKTTDAAAKNNQTPAVYSKQMAELWQSTWKSLNISNDEFIRTTSAPHKQAVYAFMEPVLAKKDLYKGKYEGLYCVGHEAFMLPDELVDGKCPEHNSVPEKVVEENYFFKLSKYQQPLLDYIEANPDFIQPESRRNEILAFIKRGLHDFSVSRAKKQWGIPWPGDDGQMIYVWFDALINYLTAAGYPKAGFEAYWPADIHLVGKDIIKFHCIYWPAMLMSADLPLPKQVFAHGFFTVEGQKISKSLGNAINPVELVEAYGVDALRYYLLREIPFGADGEFSKLRFETVYNSDLANELGNLVQRTAGMIVKYLGGETGPVDAHSHDISQYTTAMKELRFDRALEEVWEFVKGLNQYVEEEKPWVLARNENDGDLEHLKEVLIHLVQDLLQVAGLLMPFMPESASKIFKTFSGGKVDAKVGILFPRIEVKPTDDTLGHVDMDLPEAK